MTQDIVDFACRVVAERRSALGEELLRLLRSGVVEISFDDPRLRPFIVELELAEQLCTFAEGELGLVSTCKVCGKPTHPGLACGELERMAEHFPAAAAALKRTRSAPP